MKDHVLRAAAVNQQYARKLVADIPDDKMAAQPAPGMNHAAWILGHLTFVADSMIRIFDQPFLMPKEWVELFNVASKPTSDRARYPSKAALLEAYEKAYARLTETVKAAPSEAFEREFPNPKLRPTLPTVGVAMVHILTSHHALHLGQLSAWRRAMGMPPSGTP
ncbi:MAG: DinB family protein [Planctomycetia bacterium]|nr:DinB family protein [Planctomycetia bacterium]